MGSRYLRRGAGLWWLVLGGVCLVALSAGAEDTLKRVGVVDVSRVFEEYQKVKDFTAKMKGAYDTTFTMLKKKNDDLQTREEQLKLEQPKNPDLVYVKKMQQLQYEKVEFQINSDAFLANVEKERTEEMKKVLNDIRAAIHFIGAQDKLDLVLRAPEFENEFNPDKDKEKDKDAPKTAGELVRKFRENPLLYFDASNDITRKVIDRLNAEYKQAAPVPAPAPK